MTLSTAYPRAPPWS